MASSSSSSARQRPDRSRDGAVHYLAQQVRLLSRDMAVLHEKMEATQTQLMGRFGVRMNNDGKQLEGEDKG